MAVVVVLLSLITLSLVVLLVRERMRTKSLRSRFGPIVDLSEAHARLLKEHEEAKKRMDAQRRELDQALRTERETLERQAQTVRRDLAARHEQVQRDAQTLKEQYGPVADLTLKRARLVEEQALLEDEIQTRRQRFEDALATATAELNRLTAEVASLETKADLASFGFYAPHYAYDTSERYKSALEAVREQQATMIKSKVAATCSARWELEGSVVKGRQMTDRLLKLLLRAFNGECDAAVSKVKYNNIATLEARINRSYEVINKLGETNRCEISAAYLNLKLAELFVQFDILLGISGLAPLFVRV